MDSSNPLSIRFKLFTLFIVPLFIFLVVSLVQIDESGERTERISKFQKLTDFAIYISALVHETQKERGATGIFLTSEGRKFDYELQQQRKQTDEKRKLFLEFIEKFKQSDYSDSFNRSLSAAMDELDKLDNLRLAISDMEVDVDEGIYYYSFTNALFLDVIGTMIHNSVEPKLTRSILTYLDFLKGKERAGIERAVLGAAFTQDKFSPGRYYRFVQLVTEQNSYYQDFIDMATPEQVNDFNNLSKSSYFINVQKFRDIAHKYSDTGKFGVNAAEWFRAITNKINELKLLEDRIAYDLSVRSQQLKEESKTAQWVWISLIIMATLAAIIIGIWQARQINTSFNRRLEEYRNLFENSAAGMFVAIPESHKFLFCNSTFAKMLGRNKDDVPGLSVTSMHPPERREEAEILFDRFSAGEIDSVEEFPFLDGKGKILTVEIVIFPILIEGERYIVGNIKDITKRKFAEVALQKSQQTLQTILNSLNAAVAVVSPETLQPIYLNQRAEDLYQQSNRPGSEWVLLDTKKSPRKLLTTVTDNIEMKYIEHLNFQGAKRWFEIMDKGIGWYDGRVLGLRMLEDITERYETEHKNKFLLDENRKLAQRNYDLQEIERRQIAAELHDQLGQLMTGIMLQADYIFHSLEHGDSELSLAAKDIVETIQKLIKAAQGVTNKLRPVILDQLGLTEALSDLVSNWQRISKETTFQFEVQSNIPQLSDKVSICAYRIVQESLTNASKHSSASDISVFLRFEEYSDITESAALLLTICDNGAGIDIQTDQHTGMGMINMRERIQAISGVFKVVSTPDKGVTIFAAIPIK